MKIRAYFHKIVSIIIRLLLLLIIVSVIVFNVPVYFPYKGISDICGDCFLVTADSGDIFYYTFYSPNDERYKLQPVHLVGNTPEKILFGTYFDRSFARNRPPIFIVKGNVLNDCFARDDIIGDMPVINVTSWSLAKPSINVRLIDFARGFYGPKRGLTYPLVKR